jgi:hypothetical protein
VIWDDEHSEPASESPIDDRPLSDTQADLHVEGKALTDDSKDLGERLAEIIERRQQDG